MKYLEHVPEAESRWQGDCFLFDPRVAVGHGLQESDYGQCCVWRPGQMQLSRDEVPMTKSAVCYTCVTNGYDAVEPVSPGWSTHFIMFHDNSVQVPEGWHGVNLSVPGVSGIDLNRYAKMLPHRMGLPASRSLYVDGNIFFRADPAQRIHDALANHPFAAMAHPAQDCAYSDIERTLKLGFVWPRPARRACSNAASFIAGMTISRSSRYARHGGARGKWATPAIRH